MGDFPMIYYINVFRFKSGAGLYSNSTLFTSETLALDYIKKVQPGNYVGTFPVKIESDNDPESKGGSF